MALMWVKSSLNICTVQRPEIPSPLRNELEVGWCMLGTGETVNKDVGLLEGIGELCG